LEKGFKQSLIRRSYTGLGIIIPFLALIYLANIYVTTIVIASIALLSFREWTKLSNSKTNIIDTVSIILFAIGCFYYELLFLKILIIAASSAWILLSVFLLLNKLDYLKFMHFDSAVIKILLITGFLSSLLVITQIENNNHLLLFIVIVNTALVDIFAYLIGSRYGKTPLLQNISPNKTLEGLLGGILSSMAFIVLLFIFFNLSSVMALILFISSIFAFVGDYSISYLKRRSSIKDTGNILPGHGGILDRVDSHLSAATIFTFLYIFIQISGI
tara:strand:- start:152 stop:970 length:819 start_codon:yes stop_codon:yes gene_type:complete